MFRRRRWCATADRRWGRGRGATPRARRSPARPASAARAFGAQARRLRARRSRRKYSWRVRLSIVVPTYNERTRLGELVEAVFQQFAAHGIDGELVIVDDGSPDGTGELADELATRHRIQVVHRAGKLGLGTAVIAGFAVARGEILGVMDADLSHPAEALPRLLAALEGAGPSGEGADMAIGSRYVPGGGVRNWPLH